MSSLHPAPTDSRTLVPRATRIRLAIAWLVTLLFLTLGEGLLAAPTAPLATLLSVVLVGTIIMAAFVVVREADHLAEQLGEPYGTLILTLSVVGIEVILIAAVMLGPGEFPTIGRDSIFAVMMIILNLVTGLCVLLGAWRHGAQAYNAQGASAYLAMIALLTGMALLLPNATVSGGPGMFSPAQAIAFSALTVVLYAAFLALQMGRCRHLFVQPAGGAMAIGEPAGAPRHEADQRAGAPGGRRTALVRSLVLLAALLPIVLLSHSLAVVVDYGISAAGLPTALGGLVIAIIVFTPESVTAVRAARANEMQRVMNLCLGAFVSTVGLTVPAVLTIGLLTGKTVVFGISAAETVLFGLTLLLSLFTFMGQRTTPVAGLAHLALFAVFGVLLFAP